MAEEVVDQELMAAFIDESVEALSGIPEIFIQVEREPENVELLNAIFRPVHTIKGSSAFFGLGQLKNLAHMMENVMDKMRKKELVPNKAIIDTMLEGVDYVNGIFERVRGKQPEVADQEGYEKILQKVKDINESNSSPEKNAWGEVTKSIEKLLQSPLFEEAVNEKRYLQELQEALRIFNPDKSKASAAPAGKDVPEVAELKVLLSEPLHDQMEKTKAERVGVLLQWLITTLKKPEALAKANKALEDYTAMVQIVGFDSLLQEVLQKHVKDMMDMEPLVVAAPEAPKAEAATPVAPAAKAAAVDPHAPAKDSGDKAGKSMRVAEETVDTFLSYVGELIVVREMFEHLRRRFEAIEGMESMVTDYRRLTDVFTAVSSDLEKSVMGIRKVTVKSMLQKVPRIVRDVAKATQKEIDVELVGEDVQIDKSLVESLEGPLVHMVRNAADHGIEKPEVRAQAKKPAKGRVEVAFRESDDMVTLSIQDDGAGINLEAIKKKAIALNLVADPSKPMTEDEIINFLFMSGVSTAEKITDISGRGVGMDVVKRSILAAGGRIEVKTNAGKGSLFAIHLPKSVTTQIMNGFVVSVQKNKYVIPVKNIIESFPPTRESLSAIYDRDECVRRHDEMIPVIRLARLFNNSSEDHFESGILVIVEANKMKTALLVDEIIGIQQVVLKKLDGLLTRHDYFAGGALMGDGSVSLIVDVEKLFHNQSYGQRA